METWEYIASSIVPVVALIVAIFTYYASVKERHHRSSSELMGMQRDIKVTSDNVKEIRRLSEKTADLVHRDEIRIALLETRVRTLESYHNIRKGGDANAD